MFRIYNRRYTGSKYKLLDWIEELIEEKCEGDVFFDVFAGTGVVSDRMKSHFTKVIMNDFLFSNEVIYKAFFSNEFYDESKIIEYKEKYQSLKAEDIEANYFSDNFGEKYFSENDSKIIGYIREDISSNKEVLSDREYNILLASLIFSMDKIANTVGHYDAYRKIGRLEDRFIFELINPEICGGKFEIHREDANKLARRVKSDVAFIDPPYNSRQYSRFYHVLETITQWKKPKLEGTALKPPAENMSDYCRNSVPEVFADLIENIDAKYIVVTYNNTYHSKSSSSRNKITLEEIQGVLEKKGKTEIHERKHPCFNAGKTEFNDHKEFIFITRTGVHNEE